GQTNIIYRFFPAVHGKMRMAEGKYILDVMEPFSRCFHVAFDILKTFLLAFSGAVLYNNDIGVKSVLPRQTFLPAGARSAKRSGDHLFTEHHD
ncbi:MAG: hypothetical protein J6Z23_02995, partial [Lachnospiraceae bacterium]|nr:hypothetical protein [Lachnospiraceae bacterium]